MSKQEFDPLKYGATPIKAGAEFDPTQYGATPVATEIEPELLKKRKEASRVAFERALPPGDSTDTKLNPPTAISLWTGATSPFESMVNFARAASQPVKFFQDYVKPAASAAAGVGQSLLDLENTATPGADLASGTVKVVGGVAHGVKESLVGPATDIASGKPNQMARGVTRMATETIPTVMGGAGLVKGGVNALRSTAAANNFADYLIETMVKPGRNKSMVGGADPVAAIRTLPASRSFPDLRNNLAKEMKASENQLMGRIADRRAVAAEIGAEHKLGIDVRTYMEQRVNGLIGAAMEEGRTDIADSLRELMNSRLEAITKRYGSTYLTPEQILAEKRTLKSSVNFKELTVKQENINAANLGVYHGYDAALDQLIPDAAEINQNWANQIVADKLVEARHTAYRNSDIGGNSVFTTLKKHTPDAAAKTLAAKIVAKPKPPGGTLPFPVATGPGEMDWTNVAPPTNAGGYEFHSPPRVDPYATHGGPAAQIKGGGSAQEMMSPGPPSPPPAYPTGIPGQGSAQIPGGGSLIPETPARPSAYPTGTPGQGSVKIKGGGSLIPGEPPSGYPTGTPGQGSVVGKGATAILEKVEMDPVSGMPKFYHYINAAGQRFTTTVPIGAPMPPPQ